MQCKLQLTLQSPSLALHSDFKGRSLTKWQDVEARINRWLVPRAFPSLRIVPRCAEIHSRFFFLICTASFRQISYCCKRRTVNKEKKRNPNSHDVKQLAFLREKCLTRHGGAAIPYESQRRSTEERWSDCWETKCDFKQYFEQWDILNNRMHP